jgi:hypothetical protein
MNPNLTASFRVERELRAEIHSQELAAVQEKFATAQSHLAEAIDLIHSLGLAQSHFELESNIADAHFHCGEAVHEIDHHPQPDT